MEYLQEKGYYFPRFRGKVEFFTPEVRFFKMRDTNVKERNRCVYDISLPERTCSCAHAPNYIVPTAGSGFPQKHG